MPQVHLLCCRHNLPKAGQLFDFARTVSSLQVRNQLCIASNCAGISPTSKRIVLTPQLLDQIYRYVLPSMVQISKNQSGSAGCLERTCSNGLILTDSSAVLKPSSNAFSKKQWCFHLAMPPRFFPTLVYRTLPNGQAPRLTTIANGTNKRRLLSSKL